MASQTPAALFFITTLIAFSAFGDGHLRHGYVGVHGMVLLVSENNNAVVSHLPLYAKPHDYQAVFAAQLIDSRAIDTAKSELVTLVPQPFNLLDWLDGHVPSTVVKVYKGHFERGGSFWYETQLEFGQRYYKRQLDPGDQSSNGTFDKVKFQNGEALYIHRISAAPSFDAFIWSSKPEQKQTSCKVSELLKEAKEDIERCLDNRTVYFETADFRQ